MLRACLFAFEFQRGTLSSAYRVATSAAADAQKEKGRKQNCQDTQAAEAAFGRQESTMKHPNGIPGSLDTERKSKPKLKKE